MYNTDITREEIKAMTKAFENRVKKELTVDTKTYRYEYECIINQGIAVIKRLPIRDLNTTAAIDGWETVKIYK
jgi:hypothetical protein